MRSVPLLAVALLVGLAPAAAQRVGPATPCPCGESGPYPCAVTTLVALADQAVPLDLTDAQVDTLRSLRKVHLDAFHEVLGEIQALQEAVHALGRPYDASEAFALFYELGGHYAELEADARVAEASLLDVLDASQRARWAEMMVLAASYQETPPAEVGCGPSPAP